MIVVTGTMRSGTSAWMQALHVGGVPVIGEPFPERWKELRALNPDGFWESSLRGGITPQFAATMHPALYQQHAVKIFPLGVHRTPAPYLGRVVFTVREWREYVASRERFYTFEPHGPARTKPDFVAEWWLGNYGLLLDCLRRRYPLRVWSFAALLADPERVIGETFRWLGRETYSAAAASIKPAHRTQHGAPTPDAIDADMVAHLDHLYDLLSRDQVNHASAQQVDAGHKALWPRLELELGRVRGELAERRKRRRLRVLEAPA